MDKDPSSIKRDERTIKNKILSEGNMKTIPTMIIRRKISSLIRITHAPNITDW